MKDGSHIITFYIHFSIEQLIIFSRSRENVELHVPYTSLKEDMTADPVFLIWYDLNNDYT